MGGVGVEEEGMAAMLQSKRDQGTLKSKDIVIRSVDDAVEASRYGTV